uniref:Uncharacterized protein n=1 Tax=Branchiostoma floridae TaxID=7739 RepID=C3YBR7_BRAFL|eukprot:XP_002606414.1 hypothetical protein BRAFLDRAFT_67665 [Branchiostoma floridae]
MAAGQVVNSASCHQATISQNVQADDREGCGNSPNTEADSGMYETIPDIIDPYARSPYVFDVPQYHSSADNTGAENREGTRTGPTAQACDQTYNNREVSNDDAVENQNKIKKNSTEDRQTVRSLLEGCDRGY